MPAATRVVPFDPECPAEQDVYSAEGGGSGAQNTSETRVEDGVEDGVGNGVEDCGPSIEETAGEVRRESYLPKIALVCVAVACCAFAAWATLTGRLQEWMELLEYIPYPITFVIIIAIFVFMNMPFGYGYSVVVFATGFAFGWKGLPPAFIGGLLFGPWLARFVNGRLLFRDKSPRELVRWIPNATAKRWVGAILLGIQRDRCSVLIVAATRTSPLAVGIQHVVLSAAAPPFWSFAVGVVIGGMPDLLATVYMGTLVRSATDQAAKTTADETVDNLSFILLIAQVVAIVVLMGLISFATRRMLKKYDTQEFE